MIASINGVNDFRSLPSLLNNYLQSGSSSPVPSVVSESPLFSEIDAMNQELDATLDEVRVMQSVSEVRNRPAGRSEVIVKEKRVADFKPIKLDWLGVKALDPSVSVLFSSSVGEFETFYHRVFHSPSVLYLVFDCRCKVGRFIPRLGSGEISLTVDGQSYSGFFWAEAKFELGVLEITPFVIADSMSASADLSDYN